MTRRQFIVIWWAIICQLSSLIPGFAQTNGKFLEPEISSKVEMKPPFVIIERENPAYTIFNVITKMPQDLEKLASFKRNFAKAQSQLIEVVDWEHFLRNADRYVNGAVIKNDYPSVKLTKGLLEILKFTKKEFKNGGRTGYAPWGMTWNGGIAFTREDYNHAKKTYALYCKDPGEYESTKILDRRRDPIHPNNWFRQVLGREY